MIKSIILASTILSSLLSFQTAFAREAVIKSYTIVPTNGGINPDFTGFRISAVVEAADEGCEASRSKAALKMVDRDGEKVIIAEVTPSGDDSDAKCVRSKNLKADKVFRLSSAQFAATKLANVTEMGNDLLIEELFAQTADRSSAECANANEQVFCTMEYDPTTCSYGNRTVHASNSCTAKSNLRREVCAAEQSFVPTAVVCSSGEAQ